MHTHTHTHTWRQQAVKVLSRAAGSVGGKAEDLGRSPLLVLTTESSSGSSSIVVGNNKNNNNNSNSSSSSSSSSSRAGVRPPSFPRPARPARVSKTSAPWRDVDIRSWQPVQFIRCSGRAFTETRHRVSASLSLSLPLSLSPSLDIYLSFSAPAAAAQLLLLLLLLLFCTCTSWIADECRVWLACGRCSGIISEPSSSSSDIGGCRLPPPFLIPR